MKQRTYGTKMSFSGCNSLLFVILTTHSQRMIQYLNSHKISCYSNKRFNSYLNLNQEVAKNAQVGPPSVNSIIDKSHRKLINTRGALLLESGIGQRNINEISIALSH